MARRFRTEALSHFAPTRDDEIAAVTEQAVRVFERLGLQPDAEIVIAQDMDPV